MDENDVQKQLNAVNYQPQTEEMKKKSLFSNPRKPVEKATAIKESGGDGPSMLFNRPDDKVMQFI